MIKKLIDAIINDLKCNKGLRMGLSLCIAGFSIIAVSVIVFSFLASWKFGIMVFGTTMFLIGLGMLDK